MAGRRCTHIEHAVLISVFARPCVASVHEPGISKMPKPLLKTQKFNFYAMWGVRIIVFLCNLLGVIFMFKSCA